MMKRMVVLIAVSVVSLGGGSDPAVQLRGQDITSTLIQSGDWTDSGNWDTVDFPNNMNGITYEAIINSGNTVSLSASDVITLESFLISQGEITGQGLIETTGESFFSSGSISGINLSGGIYNWFRGTMAGGVVLTDTSQTVVNSGGTLPGQEAKLQGLVTNNGSMQWAGGVLNLNQSGSELVNNGDINITGSFQTNGTNSDITNNGTLAQVGGGAIIRVPFRNDGAVVVSSGNLEFENGGTATGMHLIADGANLRLFSNNSDYVISDGVTFSGNGTLQVNNAADVSLALSSGQATIENLQFSNGIIDPGNGSIDITGDVNWSRGTMAGGVVLTDTSQTVVNSGGTLPGQEAKLQGLVTNNGSMQWAGGVLNLNQSGSELVNNGDINITGSFQTNGTNSDITNNGTLAQVGGGAIIRVPFRNDGAVVVSSGNLEFENGGTATGMHLIADGANLRLFSNNSDYVISDGVTFSGNGTLQVNNAADVSLALSSGQATIENLQFSNGIIDPGNGSIDITGDVNWSRGTMAGGVVLTDTSQTVVNSGGTLPGQEAKLQGLVTNNGSMQWAGGVLNLNQSGSELVNNGDINITGSFQTNGTNSDITNNGTLAQVGGGAIIRVPFRNDGLVDVGSGTLRFTNSLNGTGDFEVAFGATLRPDEPLQISANGSQVLTNFGTVATDVIVEGGTLQGAGVISDTLTLREATVINTQRDPKLDENIVVDGDLLVEAPDSGTGEGSILQDDTLTFNGTATLRDKLTNQGVILGPLGIGPGGNAGALVIESGGELFLPEGEENRIGDQEGREVRVVVRDGGKISGEGILVGSLEIEPGAANEAELEIRGPVTVQPQACVDFPQNMQAEQLAIGDQSKIQGDGLIDISGLSGGPAQIDNMVEIGPVGSLATEIGPGQSPGQITFNNPAENALTLALAEDVELSRFVFEINDAQGAIGINWDALIVSNGGIAFDNTVGNGMTIEVISLLGNNAQGPLANFDPELSYSWRFLDTQLGFSGVPIDSLNFVVDDTQFALANGISAGLFSVQADGTQGLAVVYQPEEKVLLGDVNLDGAVNLLDVDFFIARLSTGTYQVEADCNEDGEINLLDVDSFIAILGDG